jgi:hypothetical protein
MCAVNSHEALSLRLQHILRSIWKPAVDEISMEAISIANLYTVLAHSYIQVVSRYHTSPQANLNGGTPLHPCGIAFRVSYRIENLNDTILFMPAGQLPP